MILSACSAQSAEQGDKDDIYQFGQILLEVITGKPTASQSELESLRAQVNLKLHVHITLKDTTTKSLQLLSKLLHYDSEFFSSCVNPCS